MLGAMLPPWCTCSGLGAELEQGRVPVWGHSSGHLLYLPGIVTRGKHHLNYSLQNAAIWKSAVKSIKLRMPSISLELAGFGSATNVLPWREASIRVSRAQAAPASSSLHANTPYYYGAIRIYFWKHSQSVLPSAGSYLGRNVGPPPTSRVCSALIQFSVTREKIWFNRVKCILGPIPLSLPPEHNPRITI